MSVLISSSVEASTAMFFASRCRLSIRLRVAARMSCASDWAVPAFSQAPFMPSASNSTFPLVMVLVASSAAATAASTPTSFSATSLLTMASFLSAMLFFVDASFLAAASKDDCKSVSCSKVAFIEFSASRFAAKRFIAKNVFAPPTAACAAVSALSRSANVLLAVSIGNSWLSLSKVASCSATCCKHPSASFTRAADSLTMLSTTIFSDLSRIVITVASSFSWASFTSGCNFASPSLPMLCTRVCVSRYLPRVFKPTCASAAACSASFTELPVFSPSASLPCSSSTPRVSTISDTFATFSSAALSLLLASSTIFLAAIRCSTVEQSFLYLPTSA
mmetsp:Transcript_95528/g.189349  ORF Transcript_95528/g.189349 Transcript_95528/m.189349 type:complete len:334 (+) Transcript_95528:2795-3796(+)